MNQLNPKQYNQDEDAILSAISEARTLRQADELEESQAILLDLLKDYPDHPLVLFEVGGSYDVMGEEEMAIPYYRQAVNSGLEGDDLQECLICLGSSLRLTGEYDEAIEHLEQAIEEFPNKKSGRVFLALVHYNAGHPDLAISSLLSLLLETTDDEDIQAYADVVDYYKDNLDEMLGE
jgi:tetratricopeptide (TPR) repeat protein